MAVVNIREVYPGVSLGLWQMDETVEQLFEQYPHLQAYRSQVEVNYKNYTFEVMNIEERRISKIKVTVHPVKDNVEDSSK